MAHVTASVNWIHQNLLLTTNSSPQRGVAPPNTKTDASSSDSGPSDFQELFGGTVGQSSSSSAAATSSPAASQGNGTGTSSSNSSATAAASAGNSVPTLESEFGGSPWLANPTGTDPNGNQYSYNSWYFATPQAAAQVAQMLGGTVVSKNDITNTDAPFTQNQPNLMVQMPNGNLINAGLVASFYAHGYTQSYIDTLVSNEINEGDV
jgi:hypothetical protein